MDKAEIRDIVINSLYDECIDIGRISVKDNLIDDLGLNSMQIYVLILRWERAFRIHISQKDSYKLSTVADVIELIENLSK